MKIQNTPTVAVDLSLGSHLEARAKAAEHGRIVESKGRRFAIVDRVWWEAVRNGKTTPPPTQPAAKKKDQAKPPPTPDQITLAEQRAEICRNCERVKKGDNGEPRISLTVRGFPVYKVGCGDCGCGGLSLIEGECPQGYWQEHEKMLEKQKKGFEVARQKRKEREQRRARELAEKQASQRVAKPRRVDRSRSTNRTTDQLVLRDGWGNPIHLREIYRGSHAFLLCGGLSLKEMDLEPLKQPGILTMAVNNAVKVFRPNLWTCVDPADKFLRSIWFDPTITKFVPEKLKGGKIWDSDAWECTGKKAHQCPNVVYYPRNARFNHKTFLDEPTVNWGHSADEKGKPPVPPDSMGRKGTRSVMFSAIRLLHHLGIHHVYLLGADFHMEAEQSYAFEQPKDERAARSNNRSYKHINERFEALRPLFEKRDFHVHNCTPGSKLTAFDYMPMDEAVGRAMDRFGNIDVANERTEGLYTTQKFDVTLITPTGDRPEAFKLCERWMKRQKYKGKIQWIVVDDGKTPTACTMDQKYVRREPKADDPPHTLALNLKTALEHVKASKVLVIEDDDWYAPDYLDRMVKLLDEADLVGEAPSLYYSLPTRKSKNCGNRTHASLFQTGFRMNVIPLLQEVCDSCIRDNKPFVDLRLWNRWDGSKHIEQFTPALSVGIKGQAGRQGTTSGWRVSGKGWQDDDEGAKLRELVGADARAYRRSKVSIVIPCHNRLDLTKRTLESLRQNTAWQDYEVICVDDGSTDGTHEWLQSQQIDRIIRHEKPEGIAASVNDGWLHATGDYLVKLDNDIDIRDAQWLHLLIQIVDTFPKIGLASLLIQPGKLKKNLLSRDGVEAAEPVGNLNGACLLMPREVFNQVGYCRRFKRLYGLMDADYCYRVQRAGYRIAYVPGETGEIATHLQDDEADPAYTARKQADRKQNHQQWLSVRDTVPVYCPHHRHRRLLITGHSRSGTGYMAKLAQAYGLDVGHEVMGNDGISSWMFAVDADDTPHGDGSVRRDFTFDSILHVVRHPLKVIASAMQTESRKSWAFRRRWADMPADYNEYEQAVQILLAWENHVAAQSPAATLRVEDAAEAFAGVLGLGEPAKPLPPLNTNTRRHTDLTWSQLAEHLRPELADKMREYADRHGYELEGSYSRM